MACWRSSWVAAPDDRLRSLLSVLIAALAAAVLGYFMIWGRIGGVFFGIVTLAATLSLAFFLGQTAGPEWHIGAARLNGFNGMKGMDPLTVGEHLYRRHYPLLS